MDPLRLWTRPHTTPGGLQIPHSLCLPTFRNRDVKYNAQSSLRQRTQSARTTWTPPGPAITASASRAQRTTGLGITRLLSSIGRRILRQQLEGFESLQSARLAGVGLPNRIMPMGSAWVAIVSATIPLCDCESVSGCLGFEVIRSLWKDEVLGLMRVIPHGSLLYACLYIALRCNIALAIAGLVSKHSFMRYLTNTFVPF